jgi:hypothetical protein
MTSMAKSLCKIKIKLSIGRRKHKLIKHQQHDVVEKFTTSVVFSDDMHGVDIFLERMKFNFIKLKNLEARIW